MATFDTHAIVTQLERAGIETVQAEALTDVFKSLHDTLVGQLATKGDVREAALQRAPAHVVKTGATRRGPNVECQDSAIPGHCVATVACAWPGCRGLAKTWQLANLPVR